jgi:pimeloyl-ACP methyl ester carboxylesterase
LTPRSIAFETTAQMDLTQQLEHRLPDGRTLAYATWGNSGLVVIHHHGTGSSRFEAAALARAADGLPLRVIGIDRPGCGASTHDPKRDFRSVHADLEHLADALGIERFFVSGVSGGAAFASTAALFPRTIKCYPLNMSPDLGSKAAPLIPVSLRIAIWLMVRPMVFRGTARRARVDPLARVTKSKMPEIDKKVLLEEIPDIWVAAVREGSRLGTDGIARDTILLRKPWGINWDEMLAPVEIRQGEQDPFLPFPRALVPLQPNTTLIEFEGGHTAALGRAVLRGVAEDMLQVAGHT